MNKTKHWIGETKPDVVFMSNISTLYCFGKLGLTSEAMPRIFRYLVVKMIFLAASATTLLLSTKKLVLFRAEVSANPKQGEYRMNNHQATIICIVQVHEVFKLSTGNRLHRVPAYFRFETGR